MSGNTKKDERDAHSILCMQCSIEIRELVSKSGPQGTSSGKMQTVVISVVNRSIPASKILLCVLLASLAVLVPYTRSDSAPKTYFCRFSNLLPDDLPLVGVVFLDSGKQRRTLLTH